jgi:hypothetical protein
MRRWVETGKKAVQRKEVRKRHRRRKAGSR